MGHHNSKASILTRISWKLGLTFLSHAIMVIIAACTIYYLNGQSFFLTRRVAIPQANGSIIYRLEYRPTQSDITTIVNILASAARTASSLWVAAIDLRCLLFFLERGGITYQGLKTITNGWIPGIRQFQRKSNFVIFVVLHVVLLLSSFFSTILTGSITWIPSQRLDPTDSHMFPPIPLGQTGDLLQFTGDASVLDSMVSTLLGDFYMLWGAAVYSRPGTMYRLLRNAYYLPTNTTIDKLTVPYFAVDSFEWIIDPNSTLTDQQKMAVTVVNATAPRAMNLGRWGLIPDGNWGPYDQALPAPHTVAESRIFMGTYPQIDPDCPIPGFLQVTNNVTLQPYVVSLDVEPTCVIFANVTYRAGAAHCEHCWITGQARIQSDGDLENLQLIDDSATRVALSIAPYVSTVIANSLPEYYSTPGTMEDLVIGFLSQTYQVAWMGITDDWGSGIELTGIHIAVNASEASVAFWRVAVWASLHALQLILGLLFVYLNMRNGRRWLKDPNLTALLADSSLLHELAGADFQVVRKLERNSENREYIVVRHLRRNKRDEEPERDEAAEADERAKLKLDLASCLD